MVKTVTLAADTPQKVTFEGTYPYYWIDNKTASGVYASVGVPEADADGTYTVAAGSQMRISGGVGNDGITLLGEGKVQIVASAIAACPFKSASGGGGIKFINGLAATDGEVKLTQSLIPSDGTAYQMPYFVQSGTVTIDRSAINGIGITFPVKYKSAPLVLISSQPDVSSSATSSTSYYPSIVNVREVTAEDFKLFAWGSASRPSEQLAYAHPANWIAFGELAEV